MTQDVNHNRMTQILAAIAYGDCLGSQVEKWSPQDYEAVFESLPQLLTEWPARVRGLSASFRRRLRKPSLYGWHTQLVLTAARFVEPDSETSSVHVFLSGFESRGWRGYSHDFLRLLHRAQHPSVSATQTLNVIELSLLGLLPHFTERSLPETLTLLSQLTDSAFVRWATVLVYLVAQDNGSQSLDRLIDLSLEQTPVDLQRVHEVRDCLNQILNSDFSDHDPVQWHLKLRHVCNPTGRHCVQGATETTVELCLVLLGAYLAAQTQMEPCAVLNECASWGGRSAYRCSILGAVMAIRSAEKTDWMESFFEPVKSALAMHDVNMFWNQEARLSTGERAFVDELTTERRSPVFAELS